VLWREGVPRLLPHKPLPLLENLGDMRFEILAEPMHHAIAVPHAKCCGIRIYVGTFRTGGWPVLVKGLPFATAGVRRADRIRDSDTLSNAAQSKPGESRGRRATGLPPNGHARRAASESIPGPGAMLAAFRMGGPQEG
jgi:hypothetical protein